MATAQEILAKIKESKRKEDENLFRIDIRFNLKTEEAKSTAGFLDKKIGKTFGTRDKIKFTSVNMDKEMFNKIEEMAKYYSISKSAMIRLILDTEMSK